MRAGDILTNTGDALLPCGQRSLLAVLREPYVEPAIQMVSATSNENALLPLY